MDRLFLVIIVGSLIALVAMLGFNGLPADTNIPTLARKEHVTPP
jgi:hypothetical protein